MGNRKIHIKYAAFTALSVPYVQYHPIVPSLKRGLIEVV